MNVSRVGLVIVLMSMSLLLSSSNDHLSYVVKANSKMQGKSGLPAFLEKGKTYNFYFALSQSDGSSSLTQPLAVMGKIVQLDVDAGWVYINHYVAERKEKVIMYKYQGYSWINMNQVFQCSEMPT